VRAYGISRLARALGTSRSNAQAWVHAARPICVHPLTGRKLLWLSRGQPLGAGPLAWQDFYEGTRQAWRVRVSSEVRSGQPAATQRYFSSKRQAEVYARRQRRLPFVRSATLHKS